MRLGRKIKIGFYTLLGVFFTLLAALVITVVWVANYPRPAFTLAERFVLPKDLSIKWEQMDFSAQRASWRHWELAWKSQNLKVEKGSPGIDLLLPEAAMRFTFRLFQEGPWLHFQEISAKTGQPARFKAAPSAEEKPDPQSPFEHFQAYLGYLKNATRWVSVDNMAVEVPAFTMVSADGQSTTNLQLKLEKPAGEKDSRATGFTAGIESGETKVLVDGWLDATRLGGTEDFLLVRMDAGRKAWKTLAQLTGRYQGEEGRFTGRAEIIYGEGPKAIKAQPLFRLNLSAAEAVFELETAVRDIPGPLLKLDKLKAEIRQPFDKSFAWSERPLTFKVTSPVELFFIDKDMRPPLEKSCRCKIPETLVVTIEGRSWLEAVLGTPRERASALDAKVTVESVDNKLLKVNLAAFVNVDKQMDKWFIEPRLDSYLSVQSFQGLRQFLDASEVMIPAPFDILDGKITVSARGNVDHDDKLIRTAVDVKVDLSSHGQRVDVESTITLDLARDFKGMDVFISSLLRQVRVELPPIDPIRGIPSITADPRLLFKPQAPKKPSAFKLRVFFDVKTANPGAVQLLSNLAEPYAPVTIDVNNSKKGESAGSVRLEPFDISYLRRKVHVERLQVTLSEDEDGDFPIGGRFRLDQTAYKIYVDIAGTLDAPIVNLNSEPFLPRADIISVLLFDRLNEQLVSADADTAGSFEAALADRAIGLFGLWAFATTPIRSFSYNAVTKVYTATVQLADGLTAGVGTNWERAAHLEVRKRVSRRWVLTASWSPSDERSQVGKLVLQWEKRF